MPDEDLPHQHGVHEYNGHKLTLMHQYANEGVWEVYNGSQYLGSVAEAYPIAGETWTRYTATLPGEEDLVSEGSTDDWRSAVAYLADEAGL